MRFTFAILLICAALATTAKSAVVSAEVYCAQLARETHVLVQEVVGVDRCAIGQPEIATLSFVEWSLAAAGNTIAGGFTGHVVGPSIIDGGLYGLARYGIEVLDAFQASGEPRPGILQYEVRASGGASYQAFASTRLLTNAVSSVCDLLDPEIGATTYACYTEGPTIPRQFYLSSGQTTVNLGDYFSVRFASTGFAGHPTDGGNIEASLQFWFSLFEADGVTPVAISPVSISAIPEPALLLPVGLLLLMAGRKFYRAQ